MQLHGTGGAWIPRFHLCWENGHSSRLLCQRTPVHTKAVIPSSHLFKIRLMNIGTNVYQVCTYVLFRAWELQTVQSCGLMVSWNGQVCKRGRIGSSRDIDHVQNEPWHSWLDQRSVPAIFCNHINFLGVFSKHFVYECAIVILLAFLFIKYPVSEHLCFRVQHVLHWGRVRVYSRFRSWGSVWRSQGRTTCPSLQQSICRKLCHTSWTGEFAHELAIMQSDRCECWS